jgi:hypothetical protein
MEGSIVKQPTRVLCLVSILLPFLLSWNATARADHSETLGNLNYYPHLHRLLLTPRVTTTLHESTAVNNDLTGQQTSDTATNFTDADITLTYGLLPGLRVGANETELFSSTTNHTNASGTTTQTSSSGPSDPTFFSEYRYFEDDEKTRISADVDLSGSPSIVIHDNATTSQNGNNGRGYGTLSLTAPVYWWVQWNEIELSPEVTRNFSGNSQGAAPASSTYRNANYTGSVTLFDRAHFLEKFYIQASAVFDIPYSVHTITQNPAAISRTTQYPFHVVPRANLGWLIRKNILLDAEYDYYNYTTTVAETSSSTSNDESTVAFRFYIEL